MICNVVCVVLCMDVVVLLHARSSVIALAKIGDCFLVMSSDGHCVWSRLTFSRCLQNIDLTLAFSRLLTTFLQSFDNI